MPHIHRVLSCVDSRSKQRRRRRHEQKARLVPLLFTTEGSSYSKRISTHAILALTSLPNIFMDVVASLHRSHTCSKVKVHITAHRATKFKTTKFNSGGLIELFTKISTHENNLLCGKTSACMRKVNYITMTDLTRTIKKRPHGWEKTSSIDNDFGYKAWKER